MPIYVEDPTLRHHFYLNFKDNTILDSIGDNSKPNIVLTELGFRIKCSFITIEALRHVLKQYELHFPDKKKSIVIQ